jgi:hypothetical protein
LEIYITNDKKIIIVNSPYGLMIEQDQLLINYRWIRIYPLYAHDAATFIKVFDTIADVAKKIIFNVLYRTNI